MERIYTGSLVLGFIALALAVIFWIIAQDLSLDSLFLIVAIVIVCAVAGLLLSALGLFRNRRRGRGLKMPVSALAVNGVAIAVIVVPAVLFVLALAEPTHEEAIEELTQKGLTVQTIGSERPALLVLSQP